MSRLGHAGVGEDGVNSYQVYKYGECVEIMTRKSLVDTVLSCIWCHLTATVNYLMAVAG